jgi:hypothetical protein
MIVGWHTFSPGIGFIVISSGEQANKEDYSDEGKTQSERWSLGLVEKVTKVQERFFASIRDLPARLIKCDSSAVANHSFRSE